MKANKGTKTLISFLLSFSQSKINLRPQCNVMKRVMWLSLQRKGKRNEMKNEVTHAFLL